MTVFGLMRWLRFFLKLLCRGLSELNRLTTMRADLDLLFMSIAAPYVAPFYQKVKCFTYDKDDRAHIDEDPGEKDLVEDASYVILWLWVVVASLQHKEQVGENKTENLVIAKLAVGYVSCVWQVSYNMGKGNQAECHKEHQQDALLPVQIYRQVEEHTSTNSHQDDAKYSSALF